jgi:NAD(P)-dependent dehydrogenase (short-subunit alcohol dehydrogenase family)
MDMQGKHVLVTGATGGIGEQTTLALARKGARLTLVGRSPEKLDATVARLRAEVPDVEVATLRADLSLVAETRAAGEAFLAQNDSLDVLVNNAGALFLDRSETAEGRERTLATNHLGYFVLTDTLLPALRKAAKDRGEARVVSVASAAHRVGAIDWDDLDAARNYGGWRQYGTSKLMNILFAAELARREADHGILSNSLHPGVIATGFARNESGITAWLAGTFGPWFLISAEKGAATSIHLASSPNVRGMTGQYFARCKPTRPRPSARDEAAARRLWDVTRALVS